jgi:hypothetical protein
MPKKTYVCSICGKSAYGFGANPEPFKGDRCCEDCDARFVIPTRLIFGRDADPHICDIFTRLAQLGKMFVNQRAAGPLSIVKSED